MRKGDNLYSDCLIALDPDTGAKKWHFQYTPHDHERLGLDADADSGRTEWCRDSLERWWCWRIAMASTTSLDRTTGKFIAGKPYVKQTWATGLDEAGRPMRVPNAVPTAEGTLIWPSLAGGSNWYSSTYNPKTDLYYVNVKEMGGDLSQGRRRVQGRRAVQRRRPDATTRARSHTARCARSKSPPASCAGSTSCTRLRMPA